MLADFLRAIDLAKSRVVHYPRYLFLCGGKVPARSATHVPVSLRQALLEKIATDHPDLQDMILLAEKIFDKFDADHYGDLLTFERDLALFCSAIIIILESPGAIAEFGSFVLLDEVIGKLHAVVDSSHYRASSFIRRGPVEYLKRHDDNQVFSYDWLIRNGRRPAIPKVRAFASDIIDEIVAIYHSYPTSHAVDLESRAHHMLLLASLLRVAQPLTITELVQFASHISNSITRKDLEQYLSMLVSLGLIEKDRYGNIDYYANLNGDTFVNWAFHQQAPQNDIFRWIIDIRSFFEKHDKRRLRLLKKLRKGR
jgi:hypothetical protein